LMFQGYSILMLVFQRRCCWCEERSVLGAVWVCRRAVHRWQSRWGFLLGAEPPVSRRPVSHPVQFPVLYLTPVFNASLKKVDDKRPHTDYDRPSSGCSAYSTIAVIQSVCGQTLFIFRPANLRSGAEFPHPKTALRRKRITAPFLLSSAEKWVPPSRADVASSSSRFSQASYLRYTESLLKRLHANPLYFET